MSDNEAELSEENKAYVDSLRQRRTTILCNIRSMQQRIGEEDGEIDTAVLECRLQIVESYFQQISEVQNNIETLAPTDTSRTEIEETYISIKSKMLSLINSRNRVNDLNTSVFNATSLGLNPHHNRLPTLKLPKFDGKYAEYKRFIRTFSNLVHDDPLIPKLDKFNYLLNCLSGPALSVIEPFQVTEENYLKALQRLKERYDNNVLIFRDYIASLFSIPMMKGSDAVSLRNVIDTVAAVRGSLLSLGSEKDIINSMFIYIVLSKIDTDSKAAYNQKQGFETLPSWDDCYKWLSRHCQYLETCPKKENLKVSPRESKPNGKRTANSFVSAKSSCLHCKSIDHNVNNCPPFLALSAKQRFEFVKQSGACINCLRTGHIVSKCTSHSRCRVCQQPHHSNLHFPSVSATTPDSTQSTKSSTTNQSSSGSTTSSDKSQVKSSVSLITRSHKTAIIPTALIYIQNKFGQMQPVRALLDSCSELNFITEGTAKRLQLKRITSALQVSGISDVQTNIKFAVNATIKSRIGDFSWSSKFAITKRISAKQPYEFIDTTQWCIPPGIQLADPLFHKPQRIDLLLNTEVFFECLQDGTISLGEGLPILHNTKLGWIVGGKLEKTSISRPFVCNVALSSKPLDIDNFLQRFWEIEEFAHSASTLSEEQRLCEQHFSENVKVQNNGRIQVRLPFKCSPDILGNSFENAKKRFFSLERRLQRDKTLKSMYSDFINEYVELGHMSPITNFDLKMSHYIVPHHCVLKPQSTTTKLRVVFDASARTTSNYSLNDVLMVGPTIQPELIITLLSFRLHRYALTADVSKMYRQFLVAEEDRRYQLIFWRHESHEPLQLFQLNTVTYGLAAAPFLAIRSLVHIADLNEKVYPAGASAIRHNFYVDDLLTGAETKEELISLKFEIIEALKGAGLSLTKWHSNSPQLSDASCSEIAIKTNEEDITKALGTSWKPSADTFCFRFDLPDAQPITKRSVLSILAKMFDVLGLLAPVIIRGKILLQEIWIRKLQWDETLPQDLQNSWLQIKSDLQFINNIEIPRHVCTSSHSSSEFHGFADASTRAYGCCIYVRSNVDGIYKTRLLIAKSKVAPIKAQSLPRLELCAALLLSRTWQKILHNLNQYCSKVYFWTDSEIVLQWMQTHSSTLNCFVANRVSELQENTKEIIWKHVPSKDNPADIVSCGSSAVNLLETIWFTGPDFLSKEFTEWPVTKKIANVANQDLERRKAVSFKCSSSSTEGPLINSIIDRSSSYYRLLRTTSYVFRAFNKVAADTHLRATMVLHVSHTELELTFWRIVSQIQQIEFAEEIECLRKQKQMKPFLQKLTPFLHEMKVSDLIIPILRVGGRLSKAPIPFDAKFPALLPKEHRFTALFVEYLHRKNLHAGPQVLLSLMREKVWVINGRDIARKTVRNCVHCFHYKPRLMNQIMADLPAERLQIQTPFLISGVDFCGPFATTYRLRGKSPYKTYIAIFVCFGSKAVHAELVSDLSTNNFLLCLKRFIGRRGIPQRIYCDNATNFIGAQAKLKELQHQFFNKAAIDEITSYSNITGFEFSFISPRAPHFGGIWEAAVKSMKTILIKNITKAHLTYEELQTVIIEVEAILNSRPLTPLSTDPNDLEPLTPGHLLIGRPLLSIPDKHIEANKLSSLTHWQRVSYLKQHFWEVWSRDYIISLQERSKWLKPEANIEVGQMVIIHEDNLPPQRWQLGRIVKTIPGSDGKVRVVDIKTTKGIIRRAIRKIAPLPTSD